MLCSLAATTSSSNNSTPTGAAGQLFLFPSASKKKTKSNRQMVSHAADNRHALSSAAKQKKEAENSLKELWLLQTAAQVERDAQRDEQNRKLSEENWKRQLQLMDMQRVEADKARAAERGDMMRFLLAMRLPAQALAEGVLAPTAPVEPPTAPPQPQPHV